MKPVILTEPGGGFRAVISQPGLSSYEVDFSPIDQRHVLVMARYPSISVPIRGNDPYSLTEAMARACLTTLNNPKEGTSSG